MFSVHHARMTALNMTFVFLLGIYQMDYRNYLSFNYCVLFFAVPSFRKDCRCGKMTEAWLH